MCNEKEWKMSAILICQLMEMRLYIERNVKLKFKGCNHPNQTRLLNRPRRQNASPDFILGPTRVNPLAFSRSSSMTQLPTIRNTNGCHNNKLNSFRLCWHKHKVPLPTSLCPQWNALWWRLVRPKSGVGSGPARDEAIPISCLYGAPQPIAKTSNL